MKGSQVKTGPDRQPPLRVAPRKLKNEAVIYLSLEHPHIARLFDVYEDNEQAPNFYMEFV